jgi:oligosaccharide repeat unit polymerase
MTLRRLNASLLSPLVLFPIAWALIALLAQVHILHIQNDWSSVMVAVVIAVPLSFVAGGLIGEGIALATTVLSSTRPHTKVSERAFRLFLIGCIVLGLLEVAHQIAIAKTIPLLSGNIDDARFSQGGATVLLTNLLTVAAILALTKPRDPLAREARFELATAAVAIGAFALQGGRGSVVLPIVVAIVVRWLYWGRPSPYLLVAGGLFAFLAICFGFYLRTYQHPTTPFEAELFGEVLPPLPFFLKPLIPVYLALTTNFVALQGIVDHFPTVTNFGHGVYDAVAIDRFVSDARQIGDVSGELTPPWVTSTIAGPLWADGGFLALVPGVAAAGALAAGAYAAATRTRSYRWCLVAGYLIFIALFGLYTNLWTQQIEWIIVAPLLFVAGAFAEDPKSPPGIVGAAWGKIRRMQVRASTAPDAATAPADQAGSPGTGTGTGPSRRGVRVSILSGLAVLAAVLVSGLVIQRTLPEPFALSRTMRLPDSVATAEAVFTDSQRLAENTSVWWIHRRRDRAELMSFDPATEKTELVSRFPMPNGPGTVHYDVGAWVPLRIAALFEIRQAPKRLYLTVRRSDSGRVVDAYSIPIEAPERGLERDFAIASFDEPRSDLVIVDRGPATSRVRLGIFSGESGFRYRSFGTYLPFRGVRPNRWSLEIGELAGGAEENGERATPRPDVILLERNPDRKHTNLKVVPGEGEFEGFGYQRDIDEPGDLPPSRIFLQGSWRGAPSLFEVVPDAAGGPQLRIFDIQPPAGFL